MKQSALSPFDKSTLVKRLLACILPVAVVTVGLWAHAQIAVKNQGYVPFSDAPINYRSDDLSDPIAQLQHKLDTGHATLTYESGHGYLKSVLKELQIPIDSQTLVFSKTSFQYRKISPEHPRALYYNDDVYIGQVHDGKAIEVVSFDPMQGAIFYLLDEHQTEKPKFERAELDCTQCHIAAGTRGVPGVLVRSIYPTATGAQATGTRTFITDQASSIENRWGGWYVTGKFDPIHAASMGNSAVLSEAQDETSPGKLTPIAAKFDTAEYLSDKSDVVAHLVLAHQTQAHNLITLTNYRTRIALFNQDRAAANATSPLPDNVRQQYEKPAEQLLRYMLFVDEAPLSGLGLEENTKSGFARSFASRGPRDSKGRSLRDFDLRTHIFRYPVSYLIYTESFDSIPEPAKSYLYHRLFQVLTGQDQSPEFAAIDPQAKRAAFEILLSTKRDLPAEWHAYAKTNQPNTVAQPAHSGHPRG